MQLTQPEIIQILRKRANLNQAELGSQAFNTTMDSGRTKIKNIELGRQRPTEDDLRCIGECLDVPAEQLMPAADGQQSLSGSRQKGTVISPKIIDMYPGLGNYLDMLDKAAGIDDTELIEYLTGKIGEILQVGPAADSALSSPETAGIERGLEGD
jgi:transcriptional regulator with XRE-family HTH domain